MTFSQYAAQIRALGREISLDALKGTRGLVEPLLPADLLDGVAITRDIAYGEHERHRLDVFTDGSGEKKPVLLFIHGGGFISGDKGGEGSPFYANIGAWAVKNGYHGVNMTYRLAPEHQWPSGIEDIRAVVEWIQTHGDGYGLDADNLFLMGQSAGGAHSAHYLAFPEVYDRAPHGIKGAILLSAVYDFDAMPTTEKERAYLGNDESLYEERSSRERLVKMNLPLLVTMAEFDPPEFQAQTMVFVNEWWHHRSHQESLPWHIYMLGQNHLSVALYLGLADDQLGPVLKRFIDEHL